MTKKHLQFCIYYMQTGDPQVAYKMTYPRAAVKSLAAASSRLMARPDVAEWVHGTEERVHNRMMRQFHNEHYDKLKEQLLTINEKRTVLTKIIKGETKRVRYIKGKYGPQKVEEDLPVYAVLRAVDLDTRLENFYNYLTRSDTWRKTQNIYVNTPTLQQQVNILINQTTEQEETKDVQTEIESPLQGDLGVHSRRTDTQEQTLSPAAACPAIGGRGVTTVTGVEPSRRTLAQEIPPLNLAERSHEPMRVTPEVPCEHRAEDVHSRRTDNTSPHSGAPIAIGVGANLQTASPLQGDRGKILAPKKTPHYLTTEPVSSLRQRKNINRLTKVNRMNTGKTAGKTSNASVPPPARTSPPPPAGDKANTNEPTGVYNQLQCIGSGDVSLRST